MIPLNIKIATDDKDFPFVVRMPSTQNASDKTAILENVSNGINKYKYEKFRFSISSAVCEDLSGDVLLVNPRRQNAHRLIRSKSEHNTLLITEQCDQLCLMCSQPPKAEHVDMFSYYYDAALLSPKSICLGISGGEPLLHKDKLFNFIETVLEKRPDLSFHILTNGQHFSINDLDWLRMYRDKILWGIPLYSHVAEAHDKIVGKPGAFEILMENLSILGVSASLVELRTVVLKQNIEHMVPLSDFITTRLSFISKWAIMQLERIGFARRNWNEIFFDNSENFTPLHSAIDVLRVRNFPFALYNFPLCTIPDELHEFAARSISDWKQKYLNACTSCSVKAECCGFFEWYKEDSGFKEIKTK